MLEGERFLRLGRGPEIGMDLHIIQSGDHYEMWGGFSRLPTGFTPIITPPSFQVLHVTTDSRSLGSFKAVLVDFTYQAFRWCLVRARLIVQINTTTHFKHYSTRKTYRANKHDNAFQTLQYAQGLS